MLPALIVEDLDVVEQFHLCRAVAFKPFTDFALHRRKEALDHGVVVAVAAPAHAARDSVEVQHRSIVFARVGASLVGVMQEPAFRAAPLQRHLEGFDGHVPVVNRADRPTHDESRKQIQSLTDFVTPMFLALATPPCGV